MLSAKRKTTGEPITAYLASQRHGPFICPDCNEEVILKMGRKTVNHFAHANPIACKFATGESDEHRQCKMEIFRALQAMPGVRNVELERPNFIHRVAIEHRTNILKLFDGFNSLGVRSTHKPGDLLPIFFQMLLYGISAKPTRQGVIKYPLVFSLLGQIQFHEDTRIESVVFV